MERWPISSFTTSKRAPALSKCVAVVASCFMCVESFLTRDRAQDIRLPSSFLLHNRSANSQFPHLSRQWPQSSQPHTVFLCGYQDIHAVLLSGQDQLLDFQSRVRMMVGKRNEGHDLSIESLKC